jgi:hypothetical protein
MVFIGIAKVDVVSIRQINMDRGLLAGKAGTLDLQHLYCRVGFSMNTNWEA